MSRSGGLSSARKGASASRAQPFDATDEGAENSTIDRARRSPRDSFKR